MSITYSLQDFSLVNSFIQKYKLDYNFSSSSNAFYYFVLDLLMNLQDDEMEDAITDSYFLQSQKRESGHDRGIDVVFIDDSNAKAQIHLFNFKYCETFDKTKSNFPSGENDKIVGYINMMMQQDPELLEHVNPALRNKTEEIWEIFNTQNPEFILHLCSNHYNGLEQSEKKRLERELGKYSSIEIVEHGMVDWVNLLTKDRKKKVSGKIRAIDKNYFEKSFGDIRALVANFDAKDLIRIILNNDDIREFVDLEDYEQLVEYEILEDAFEDNVRVYLKQRTKINRNIKETALSEESHRFFYYNNGITITCDKFTYEKRRAPIIELENLQIVNGSQTLHALFDAFKEDPSCLEDIDLLVRIYETTNDALTTKIAEYTNSQNPVNSRDIRAIDYNQMKLESELFSKGYFYERKKNQYQGKPKNLRIDAEKAGQVLMAFYNEMPNEAKNNKGIIFSEKYDDVYNDNINSTKLLLAYNLYERIEDNKNIWKKKNIDDPRYKPQNIYLNYATYYFLYVFSKIGSFKSIELREESLENLWKYYEAAQNLINQTIEKERKLQGESLSLITFFKHGKPKKHIEDMIDNGEFERILYLYE